MDELELRIAVVELLALEVLADLPADQLSAAAARIREGLTDFIDADERTVREGALQVIEDARQRFVTLRLVDLVAVARDAGGDD